MLTFFGLAGPVLALIRQPVVGWSSIEVWGPGIAGIVLLGLFVLHEHRTTSPMLPLGLFKRRNFAIGNLQTFAMYGGLSVTFFFLVLFLQQVAGYDALQAGLALMPATLVMFALSKRAGRLADRLGPRLFMGFGPLVSALGLVLMLRVDAHLNYLTDLLPALLIFSLGLAATVAPLTATVLADADESNAGIASGSQQRDRARRRPAGGRGDRRRRLRAVQLGARRESRRTDAAAAGPSAVEQARKETFASVDPAVTGSAVAEDVESASNHAFQVGIGISATLVALGGVLGLAGIRNPRRAVRCEDCAGGQFAGQPLDSARERVALTEPATTGA